MFFRCIKFVIFLSIAVAFYVAVFKSYDVLWGDIIKYLIFPIILIMLNYAFLKLILYIIAYYSNLVIFYDNKVILLRTTLLKVNYVEVISLDKVTKFDIYVHWIISNLMWFWTLVIEQNRESVRKLNFVPNPHKAVRILSKMRKKAIAND
jgi:hypothetical protein